MITLLISNHYLQGICTVVVGCTTSWAVLLEWHNNSTAGAANWYHHQYSATLLAEGLTARARTARAKIGTGGVPYQKGGSFLYKPS